jgi:hypothetical protein
MLLAEQPVHLDSEIRGVTTLAGEQLLDALRGPRANRPALASGIAGGLRAWLNDACFERAPRDGGHVVITKKMVAGSTYPSSPALTYELVRGTLVAALFRLFVTAGPVAKPFEDAYDVLVSEPQHEALERFITALPERDRRGLSRELTLHARNLERRWPTLSPTWMPRTAVSLATSLHGGAVTLRGVVDLVIGVPQRDRPSLCFVSLRSTPLHTSHRDELRFLGLIETLRSGVPPFRLATYSTLTGEIQAEYVTEELLRTAVDATISAIASERTPS